PFRPALPGRTRNSLLWGGGFSRRKGAAKSAPSLSAEARRAGRILFAHHDGGERGDAPPARAHARHPRPRTLRRVARPAAAAARPSRAAAPLLAGTGCTSPRRRSCRQRPQRRPGAGRTCREPLHRLTSPAPRGVHFLSTTLI